MTTYILRYLIPFLAGVTVVVLAQVSERYGGMMEDRGYRRGYSAACDQVEKYMGSYSNGMVVNGGNLSFSNALFIIRPPDVTAIGLGSGTGHITAGTISVMCVP